MTPEEKKAIEEIRASVRDGCRKMLDLMHHELDQHFGPNGKPIKEMTEACTKRAKIVFDQCRREVGHAKPPAELEGSPPVPSPEVQDGESKTSRLSKFKIVSDEPAAQTG